jgi:hypothetical protein
MTENKTTITTLRKAFNRTIGFEGQYSNDPGDA